MHLEPTITPNKSDSEISVPRTVCRWIADRWRNRPARFFRSWSRAYPLPVFTPDDLNRVRAELLRCWRLYPERWRLVHHVAEAVFTIQSADWADNHHREFVAITAEMLFHQGWTVVTGHPLLAVLADLPVGLREALGQFVLDPRRAERGRKAELTELMERSVLEDVESADSEPPAVRGQWFQMRREVYLAFAKHSFDQV